SKRWRGGEGVVRFGEEAYRVTRMQGPAPAAAEHLIRRQAGELVEVGVAEDTGPACIHHEQTERGGLADCAQAGFALAQSTHSLAPVGDVEDRPGDPIYVAARVERGISKDLYPAWQAILAP